MIRKVVFAACLAILLFIPAARAQSAEVTISLNEQFFDSLLDAVFQSGGLPEISLSELTYKKVRRPPEIFGYAPAVFTANPPCPDTIKVVRENQAVRTAVRFRDGRIYMPIAFSGNYNPPLIGCVDFSGFAESNLDLEFDKQSQRLIGHVRVLNVSLNGTAGIGSGILTKMVQSSIDKRMDPVEIIKTEKLSFTLPIQNSTVRMEATGIRTEVANNSLLVHVEYSFPK